ncbi:hypothetical protein QBC47DRAFT_444964 [Echria macrotheca]|uniref:Uncharacterized protein n=1 Tax=Echria macrotheca TaxID=438768 RepID=A0AAJ0BFT4_9PEZI|nr:hypothetical protein QBC47DRAFT_444964 [Echria macrotheca]
MISYTFLVAAAAALLGGFHPGTTTAAPPVIDAALAPRSRNCSPSSYANVTSFALTQYQVNTTVDAATGRTSSVGTLSITNPGNGDVYLLDRIPISMGGGVWSVCLPGDGAPIPAALERCQYVIEKPDSRIGFRFQWFCDSGDAAHPLLFDATVVGELPAEVCVAKNGTAGGVEVQSCTLAKSPVPLEVENIYWDSADSYSG